MTRRKLSPEPVEGFIQELKKVFQSSQEAVIHYLTEELKFVANHMAKRPKPTEGEKAAFEADI